MRARHRSLHTPTVLNEPEFKRAPKHRATHATFTRSGLSARPTIRTIHLEMQAARRAGYTHFRISPLTGFMALLTELRQERIA